MCLALAGSVTGCVEAADSDSEPTAVAEERPSRAERLQAREERRERREWLSARAAEAAAREAEALAEQVCVEEADGEPEFYRGRDPEQLQAVVRCEAGDFIALVGVGSGEDVYWTRWWRLGTKPLRVTFGAFSRGRRPASVPSSVSAPSGGSGGSGGSGVPPGYFVGNNGYTGPRCYAPGGVYWKPC